MSLRSCQEFLRAMHASPALRQQLKSITATPELVRLGQRHGYDFDLREFAEASSSFEGPPAASADAPSQETPSQETPSREARPEEAPPRETTFLHHEYAMEDLPGFEPVLDALPDLKVRPPSVDLDAFDRGFRAEDLATTSMSPADPQFQRWNAEMMAAHWRDPGAGSDAERRDFHLVNLDQHVDHAGYDRYFDAKNRVIEALEKLFGSDVRFSGSLWYPPSGYRLWHTNETQPGWRMYVIDFDGPFADPADTSFFRYQNPRTGEIVTLPERPRIVRFFKAEQDPDRLFWHCIVNPTERHRWSFGFVVPENWADAIEGA
ncbi:Nif11-like leader peptide family natural product precursor [Actinomadura rubrisoli]|uniref:Nif11-like leader peptide family natural product n=1 Tax=Actinomadura rubrisoli TaxID=2530368 RepID=A0A4R5BUQ3_9ACTN|nr:Nif11-like leader peptide family natural product precursor [Actinomadura rubrisoli]TDD89273.1 Nif11-like leader peptide family natural product precursor [Actinomadura rubrisoli]